MSRYELEPRNPDHHPGREVVVGWDNGLDTFFLQVHDPVNYGGDSAADYEEDLTVHVGGFLGEVQDHTDIINRAAEYAEIPPELAAYLRHDYAQRLPQSEFTHSQFGQHFQDILRGKINTNQTTETRTESDAESDTAAATEHQVAGEGEGVIEPQARHHGLGY